MSNERTLIKSGLPCKWCTSSDAMAQYIDGFHCFSCGKFERKSTNNVPVFKGKETVFPIYTLKTLLNLRRDDVPQLAYLECYGITNKTISDLNILFTGIDAFLASEDTVNRRYIGPGVLFPKDAIGNSGTIRLLNPTANQKYMAFGPDQSKCFWAINDSDYEDLIIVEDCVSAAKLYQYGYNAVALTGTSLSKTKKANLVKQLSKTLKRFIIWLDGDEPGQNAAKKIGKDLAIFGNVCYIKTTQDPKCYNEADIDYLIGELDE